MAASRMRPLLPTVSATLAALAFDPELQAIAARACPSEENVRRREREREHEEALRRRDQLRQARETARNAVDGVYGPKVRDTAREIVADGFTGERTRREWLLAVQGTSEANLGRIRKLVWEWRRAGRARKGGKK